MVQTVTWKLDEDIYKQLARMMGELYDIAKDRTNLVSYYNAMRAFHIASHALLHNEDKKDIFNKVQGAKQLMEDIKNEESTINKEKPMDDKVAYHLREQLWEHLQQIYIMISDSHVKKGLYGDTSMKYDAYNAGAEFGE